MNIEGIASTEMEVVKRKESQWRTARQQLQPFLHLADLWLAASDGLPMDEINYLLAARSIITPDDLDGEEKREAEQHQVGTRAAQPLRDAIRGEFEAGRLGSVCRNSRNVSDADGCARRDG